MRELKFKRVYHEYDGSFYAFREWGIIDGTLHAPPSISGAKGGEDLQLTGHKDKNGVDIYEGDIVKSYYHVYEDSESTNTVKFIDGCWKLSCKGKADIPLFNYKPSKLEVTGNIYEVKNG